MARPELLEQRPAWAGGRPDAVSMLLEPLGPEESAALLDGLTGGGTLPATARERITPAAGGNPLFIEELLATLVEEGRLRRQGDAWTGWTAATGTCWSGPRSSGRRSSRTRWPRCPRRTPGPGSPSVWAGWSARVPAHRPGPPARRVPGGLNETRMQFTTQVTGVLLEARGEAGEERLVDPELLAALTEALILAAGDPRPWRDG